MIPFAIIGTNWITHSFVSAAHATGRWNLRAVFSRKEATAQEFAAKYDASNITLHTSLSALASDSNITTVYIASPNSLHYEHAKQLLEAGKHVVLEKPAASTSKELDELFRIAKEKGVFLIEAWRHIQEANFKVLKREVENGRVGKLYGASITYAQYSSRYDNVLRGEVPNIFNLDMSGGALADLGVYCVSAAIWLFGPPSKATYFPVKIATGADGGGNMVLQYDGFSVMLCGSKIWNSAAPSEVYGEKGTLIVPTITDIESVVWMDSRKKGSKEELGGKKAELNMREEAEEFARVIEEGDSKAAGEYEKLSREVLKVTEGMRRECGLLFAVEK